MARSRRYGLVVVLVVFVLIAAIIRLFGEPLYDMLLSLHGAPPGH